MLTNLIFLVGGILATSSIFVVFGRSPEVGVLEVDQEKEILQIVFYSRETLAKTIGKKKIARFRVVHKTLDWQVPPQEKQAL